MEKIVEQALLYDFYGELLTNHQKQIYEEHVLNDLSTSEIASISGISRQGVHDVVKRCDRILYGYEEKLHLLEKFLKTKEMVKQINQLASSILTTDKEQEIRQKVEEIEKVSHSILEEF